MSNACNNLNYLYECPIDFYLYDMDNKPVSLPCSHSICNTCIYKLRSHHCPICRHEFNPFNVKPNNDMFELIQILKKNLHESEPDIDEMHKSMRELSKTEMRYANNLKRKLNKLFSTFDGTKITLLHKQMERICRKTMKKEIRDLKKETEIRYKIILKAEVLNLPRDFIQKVKKRNLKELKRIEKNVTKKYQQIKDEEMSKLISHSESEHKEVKREESRRWRRIVFYMFILAYVVIGTYMLGEIFLNRNLLDRLRSF